MKWNGFYFPTYCSLFPIYTIVYLLHNITIHALRSQEFSAFSAFNKHLGVCVYTNTHTHTRSILSQKLKSFAQNRRHRSCSRSLAIFHSVSPHSISSFTTQQLPFENSFYHRLQYSKWPDWRVLLAVSVSQFRLSVCLNPVRHHPSTSNGKMSPFPPCSQLC